MNNTIQHVTPNSLDDCADTDNGATDAYGEGCKNYAKNPSQCGLYDNQNFYSTRMCCVCRQLVSGNIPDILYYISLYF